MKTIFQRIKRRLFSRYKDGKKIKDAFSKVKTEMDEHRESINANTNEIQTMYEYICKLESQIESMKERFDEMSMFYATTGSPRDLKEEEYSLRSAEDNEKEAFLALYSSSEHHCALSDLARRIGRDVDQTTTLFQSLANKGVPIKLYSVNNEKFLYLDPEFKGLQAKHNIMEISQSMAHEIMH